MQGKKQDKDQIDLRIEFIDKYGRIIWPSINEYVIMGLSLDKSIMTEKSKCFRPYGTRKEINLL